MTIAGELLTVNEFVSSPRLIVDSDGDGRQIPAKLLQRSVIRASAESGSDAVCTLSSVFRFRETIVAEDENFLTGRMSDNERLPELVF